MTPRWFMTDRELAILRRWFSESEIRRIVEERAWLRRVGDGDALEGLRRLRAFCDAANAPLGLGR